MCRAIRSTLLCLVLSASFLCVVWGWWDEGGDSDSSPSSSSSDTASVGLFRSLDQVDPQGGAPLAGDSAGTFSQFDRLGFSGVMRSASQQDRSDATTRAALQRALSNTASNAAATGASKCNFFVASIGKAMDVPYFRRFTPEDHDARYANQMYAFLKKAAADPKSGWASVSQDEAQQLANQGKFVVAAARHLEASEEIYPGRAASDAPSGHIAMVVPEATKPAADPGGKWPLVRDSKHFKKSVRANYAFTSLSSTAQKKGAVDITEPLWVVWKGGQGQ